ncbi:MAG: asparaginase, partial [bacterium]
AHQHFGFSDKELAVMMASHNGEKFHIKTVASILEKIGLTAEHFKCGFHLPMHQPSANKHLRQNEAQSPIYNNCSGKHAGMLALAQFHNWPVATYLEPQHPVQKRIKEMMALFSGLNETEIGVGVDGCSAPVFFLPIINMACMYAKLAEGRILPSRQVFDLMSSNPEMIAGSGRFDSVLMRVMRGRMISKVGAEGIRCLAVRGNQPLGIALKIEDGSKRASDVVLLAVLEQLELISQKERDALSEFRNPTIVNWAGIQTGRICAEFELSKSLHA